MFLYFKLQDEDLLCILRLVDKKYRGVTFNRFLQTNTIQKNRKCTLTFYSSTLHSLTISFDRGHLLPLQVPLQQVLPEPQHNQNDHL